jgi:hypothetical protein
MALVLSVQGCTTQLERVAPRHSPARSNLSRNMWSDNASSSLIILALTSGVSGRSLSSGFAVSMVDAVSGISSAGRRSVRTRASESWKIGFHGGWTNAARA